MLAAETALLASLQYLPDPESGPTERGAGSTSNDRRIDRTTFYLAFVAFLLTLNGGLRRT